VPITVDGNNITSSYAYLGKDYGYEYPEGLDLKPGSTQHADLLGKIMERARASKNVMSSRYTAWKQVDETLDGYIPADVAEQAVRSKDSRKPISIVVPASFAMLEVILSYMVAAFLQEPLFRYEGMENEDRVGAMLLEKVVSASNRRFKVGLALYVLMRDAFAYGLGAATPVWDRVYRRGVQKEEPEQLDMYAAFGMESPSVASGSEMKLAFEGNRVDNIDPYLYFPDPAVSAHQVQRGEFVAWVTPTTRTALLREEEFDPDMFNVRYVEEGAGRSSLCGEESGRGTRSGLSSSWSTNSGMMKGRVDVLWMPIDLIPVEWGVGESDRPEKWLFGVAGDKVIIKARAMELNHEMFPVVVAAPTFNGYNAAPIGSMEQIGGLQTVLNFLLNSHVTNIRKSLNDMLVVDPLLVNMNDLANPEPGRLIRLRKRKWGQGVQDAVQQLQVTDVTRQNIQEIPVILELMERVLGISANMQGVVNPKRERIAASETNKSQGMGMARLDKSVTLLEMQAIYDLADMVASQTQQLMSEDQWVGLVGRHEEELREEYNATGNRLKVRPQDLRVAYDITPYSATLPGQLDAEAWMKLFEMTVGTPGLAQMAGVDLRRMYIHTARVLGAKNLPDFMNKAQVQVRPDAEVRAQAAAGNMIPVSQMQAPGMGGADAAQM
jgi:hypothetical protein